MKLRGGATSVKTISVVYFLALLAVVLATFLVVLLSGAVSFTATDSKNLACGFVGALLFIVLAYIMYLNFSSCDC